jgi:hypothetical protein
MKGRKISNKDLKQIPVNPLIRQTKELKTKFSFCKLERINDFVILEHLKK